MFINKEKKRKGNANWRKGWSPKTPTTGPAFVGRPGFEHKAQSVYAKPPEHRQDFWRLALWGFSFLQASPEVNHGLHVVSGLFGQSANEMQGPVM